MVKYICLHSLVWNPVLDGTEKIKFHRNTVVGRLQLPHHAGQFLVYIGKTFQISGQIGPEHTQIGLTTPVDKDGIVDMMFLIILLYHRFRLLYDVKGRFVLHRIDEAEAQFKLCKVVKRQLSPKKIPFIVTHDARTIRFPDPAVKVNDTVKVDIKTNKIIGHIKFEVGNLCFITKGHNIGRVGVIVRRDRHFGSFDIVYVRDAVGHEFATRLSNVFIIGEGAEPMVSLPKGNGVKLSIIEEKKMRESKH